MSQVNKRIMAGLPGQANMQDMDRTFSGSNEKFIFLVLLLISNLLSFQAPCRPVAFCCTRTIVKLDP